MQLTLRMSPAESRPAPGERQHECCGGAARNSTIIRTSSYIDVGDQTANKRAFDLLKRDETALASQVGEPPVWERLEAKRASRIALYYPRSVQVMDPPEVLSQLRRWAVEAVLKLKAALDSRVRALKLEEAHRTGPITLNDGLNEGPLTNAGYCL